MWLPWVGLVTGVVLVAVATDSVVRTLVVPRGLTSKLAEVVGRILTRHGFIALADRFDEYETKDRILALSGPVSLLVLLFVWLAMYFVGYGLILWPLIEGPFVGALRQSGSSLLTLGFAGTPRLGATLIHLIAAGTGLVVVALQIAYLPTLYSAFNRREMLVTMLQSRAGSPAWGPELLMRAQMVSLMESLPDLYAEWERWAAEVSETHATYPVSSPAQILGHRAACGDGLGRALSGAGSEPRPCGSAPVPAHGIHCAPDDRRRRQGPLRPRSIPRRGN
jgi:hypothetical protein